MEVFNFKTVYTSIGQNFLKFTIFQNFEMKILFLLQTFLTSNDKYGGFGTPTDWTVFIVKKMELTISKYQGNVFVTF